MVGFSTVGQAPDDKRVWIVRHMIGEQCQRRGYGKAGLQKIVEMLTETHECPSIFLSVEPENHIAKAMYERAGFEDTGAKMGSELVYELQVQGRD
jgi:diamine N-acetyltransferase